MNYLTAVRSLDRYGWAMVAALLLGVPVVLAAFLLLVMVAGPLVAVLVTAGVSILVVDMRRNYRAHRARHGGG